MGWGGGGGRTRKTDIEGELPKKEELGQFANLRGGGGGLGKKEGVVFLRGVDTAIHTMCSEEISQRKQTLAP